MLAYSYGLAGSCGTGSTVAESSAAWAPLARVKAAKINAVILAIANVCSEMLYGMPPRGLNGFFEGRFALFCGDCYAINQTIWADAGLGRWRCLKCDAKHLVNESAKFAGLGAYSLNTIST